MTSVLFTSDLHLGHKFVSELRVESELIKAWEEHDERICDLWNDTVTKRDQVWVLGDLSLKRSVTALQYPLDVMRKLPGTKHFVSGNHDAVHPMHREAHQFQRAYLEVFESVQPYARRRIDKEDVLLSHFPYADDHSYQPRYNTYRLKDDGKKWLLHGHTHKSEKVTSDHEIHVGVDAWEMKPVDVSEVFNLMKQIKEGGEQ